MVGQVLAVLERREFTDAVAALGGYGLSHTGTRLLVTPPAGVS